LSRFAPSTLSPIQQCPGRDLNPHARESNGF
jgi:hypothetical protein